MQVGVGLPTGVPGTDGRTVVAWAKRADQGPFASLGVIDRLVYASYDPLAALAAAAAVTERVRLVTMIVIGPLHNPMLLAKNAASVDALASGRLTLGLAVGAREEDYQFAAVPYGGRGARLEAQLTALRDAWEDGAMMPAGGRPGGPDLLVGGLSEQGFARVARYADGYVHGGGPPKTFVRAAEKIRAAWTDAGRPGRPQFWAQAYFALGPAAVPAGDRYLRDYYAFTGPFAEKIAAGLLTTPQAIAQFVQGYADAGCEHLVLLPTSGGLDQIDALAEVLAGLGPPA